MTGFWYARSAAETAPEEDRPSLSRLTPDQRSRLERGEIVPIGVAESGEVEIAAELALLVPAPVGLVGERLAAGDLVTRDSALSAVGALPERTSPEALSGIRFTARETSEVDGLLEAEPGTHFNLAPAELEAFAALRRSRSFGNPADAAEAVSEQYRQLLFQRWHAYREGGLANIAPYARKGGFLTDPAAALRAAAADAGSLGPRGAALRETLLAYPARQPAAARSRLYWIRRSIQGRPAFGLLHQLVEESPGMVVHVERYFYVGHSYSAAQILTAGVAEGGATAMVCTSRVFTDELLGFGNQVKRTLARRQLRDTAHTRLERFRASIAHPAPAAPPESP